MNDKRRQVNFRLSEEEEAQVLKMAERAGLSFSSYCKKMAVYGKVKPQVIDKEMGKAILPHISHMGSNINQLARKANEGGNVSAAELKAVQKEFEALWDLVLYGKKPKQAKEKQLEAAGQETLEFPSTMTGKEEHCEKCGSVLNIKQSTKPGEHKGQWFKICPKYSKDDKGHTFKWVED